jgi:hypothetical protein
VRPALPLKDYFTIAAAVCKAKKRAPEPFREPGRAAAFRNYSIMKFSFF